MLPVRVGLASRSASVDFAALVKAANALNQQLSRDFTPIWRISASVVALESDAHIDPGIWPVYVVDQMPEGFAGLHQTDHNQPYATVLSGATWSLSASHEMLEMVVDPSGNRLVAAPAVTIVNNDLQDGAGKFEYLVEVCDPSEDDSCAYLIDGVLVSDFYTPNYFDPTGTAGARYSFSGKLTRPRQVLPNGYLSWVDPATGRLQQVRRFGALELVDLGDSAGISAGGDRSLRGYVDRMTRTPTQLSRLQSSAPAVLRRAGRERFLAEAGGQRGQRFGQALDRLLSATTDR